MYFRCCVPVLIFVLQTSLDRTLTAACVLDFVFYLIRIFLQFFMPDEECQHCMRYPEPVDRLVPSLTYIELETGNLSCSLSPNRSPLPIRFPYVAFL
jgi:hypothetical protein